ncbi:MAG: GTPase Era [Alphaproteobacteria bacterium]|nr:GTPase Era [Alphaproteobacteria bacterium]
MTEEQAAPPATRAGFVALIGAPNAGKSTLLNQLVGAKVSIVTHKVQTTRSRITGIAMHALPDDLSGGGGGGEAQVIFVDTPGIFTPKRRLDRAMVKAAWEGAGDADAVVLLVDVSRKALDDDTEKLLDALAESGQKPILAMNKIDLVKREQLLERAQYLNERVPFAETFMISAEKGDGCGDLLDHLAGLMPHGPFLYDPEQISDLPMRSLAAEVTREKAYLKLHDELPYALTVETDKWEEFRDGSVKIEQTIYVQRDSQKGIVLGKGGAKIKTIREMAREDLAEQFGRPVHLFLFVKVRENWVDDPERYRPWGLEWNS